MKNGIFSGNALKIIAMISMLIDHIGVILLDNYEPFRIIGRLAFPIYAYLIVEGCKHTNNRLFYLLRIFSLGVLCQGVFYFVSQSLYLNILLTFSVSIMMIYLLQSAKKNSIITVIFLIAIVALWTGCNRLLTYGIEFDYGFLGIMLPVIIALSDNRKEKVILTFSALFLLSQVMGGTQIWSLLSVIPILLYNGRRGKLKLKNFFYLFYPLHLAILYGLSYVI